MKHQFIITLTILLCINSGDAQILKTYGMKIGLTSANQTYEWPNPSWQLNFKPDKRRVGINAGIYAEWLTMPFFSFLTQLEYTQRGDGFKFNRRGENNEDLGTAIKYTRIDYISAAVLCKLRYETNIINPYLIGGPRLDYLLSYKSDLGDPREPYNSFKDVLIGFSIGAGAEITNLCSYIIIAEFRYNLDLTNSYDNGYLIIKNNAFDILIGIAI
jgi:hypothetical protein